MAVVGVLVLGWALQFPPKLRLVPVDHQPSPDQPCPTLPVAACCLLLCGQVVTVQCPVSGYNVHTIYTIYTIYTLHSRCATTAASLPGRRHSS